MKRIAVILTFIFAVSGFTFAQTPLPELEKVKQIKLLESTREDAVKVFANDIFPIVNLSNPQSKSGYYESFYSETAAIRVEYASGKCSYESEDWNVSEWIVTGISVEPKDELKIQELGIDYSKFRREKLWGSRKNDYAYHDKAAGIAVLTARDWVNAIVFTPSNHNYLSLCDKAEVKKYYSGKKWNRYPETKDSIIDINVPAHVEKLDLSQAEIITGCDSSQATQNTNCSDEVKEITVSVDVINPDNDVLTYAYYVSGGKIVGQGRQVVWDLTSVRPGTYKITAVANDGCGPCGEYMTKTVVVKECADCSAK